MHPQTEAMAHRRRKLRVEERLFESGLDYTILQPSAYMQNVLAHWDRILEQSVYQIPYALETRLDMADLEDVAAAAALLRPLRLSFDGSRKSSQRDRARGIEE